MTKVAPIGRHAVMHDEAEAEADLEAVAIRLYRERRSRDRDFAAFGPVFRDPAWDVALDVFVEQARRRPVTVSSAAIASCVPMTTGLRCVDRLVSAGLLDRLEDPLDGRRSLIRYTPEGLSAMSAHLGRLAGTPHPPYPDR